jgi:hypothetical protein
MKIQIRIFLLGRPGLAVALNVRLGRAANQIIGLIILCNIEN